MLTIFKLTCASIDVDDILDIKKYFIKMHDIKFFDLLKNAYWIIKL